jgi:hypothetical protein
LLVDGVAHEREKKRLQPPKNTSGGKKKKKKKKKMRASFLGKKFGPLALALLAVVPGGALAQAADAPATHFARLSGDAEVPGVATADLGIALLWLPAGRVTVLHNVAAGATAVHVHGPATPAENGGVLATVTDKQFPPGLMLDVPAVGLDDEALKAVAGGTMVLLF